MSALEAQGDSILVSGALTFATVPAVLNASKAFFKTRDALHFNLQSVSQCDSAGLALLISWVRRAAADDKPLSFEHLPAQLKAYAKVAGVEHLLEQAA